MTYNTSAPSVALLRKYNPTEFFALFAPSYTDRYTTNEVWCVVSPNAPTLEMVTGEYGVNEATGRTMGAAFVFMHLSSLNEYYGPDKRMTEGQLDSLASVIATEYETLKVSELMLFIRKFKAGKYGHFYGNIDPLVITTALSQFITETRPALMEQHQRERERKAAAKIRTEMRHAMTMDEFIDTLPPDDARRGALKQFEAKFLR